MTIPIGLQLWTLREECAKDFFGTLQGVAQAGYRWIEPFAFYGVSAEELTRRLRQMGLGVISSHVALEDLESNLDRVMRDHETLGCRAIVCPWLDEKRREGSNAFEKIGAILNRIGEQLRPRGFSLAYHNHDFEFTQESGTNGLERILSQAEPQNLSAQLDTYWARHAGLDPVQLIRQLGSRLSSIHLKDRDPADGEFAPVGHGSLDMPAILEAGREAGVRSLIVEQDECKRPPMEEIKRSLDFLRSQGFSD